MSAGETQPRAHAADAHEVEEETRDLSNSKFPVILQLLKQLDMDTSGECRAASYFHLIIVRYSRDFSYSTVFCLTLQLRAQCDYIRTNCNNDGLRDQGS